MKKGQITLFIALGLIILGVVGLLIYFTTSYAQRSAEQGIEQNIRDRQTQMVVDSNYDNCLQYHALEVLRLIGLQGGALYTNQQGISSHQQAYLFQNNYVQFGIRNHTDFDFNRAFTELQGQYPFGAIRLVNLCSLQGRNGIHEQEVTCPDFAYPGMPGTSLQEQIEVYLEHHVATCYTESDSIFIEVEFEQEAVVFYSTYNIIYFDEPIERQSEMRIPIRLLKLYEAMGEILIANTDLQPQNITTHRPRCRYGPCLDNDMMIQYIEGNTSIFQIIDAKSRIDGDPYVFQVAIRNRKPIINDTIEIRNGNEYIAVFDPDDNIESCQVDGQAITYENGYCKNQTLPSSFTLTVTDTYGLEATKNFP